MSELTDEERSAVRLSIGHAKRNILNGIRALHNHQGSLLWTLLDQQWTALNTLASAIERKEI